MEDALDYRQWPAEKLVKKVDELETRIEHLKAELRAVGSSVPPPSSIKRARVQTSARRFDASRYSSRHVAFKFAYLGQRYNGLEGHANNPTPLPTIEEELWKALVKTRLIFPPGGQDENGQVDWTGCDYSKAGRTDKGVSAFGQVVALRVRSARPNDVPGKRKQGPEVGLGGIFGDDHDDQNVVDPVSSEDFEHKDIVQDTNKEFDPVKDEIPYCAMLNKVLPSDIRILAWCPDLPKDFSARFSCEERQYRYFFTNPAYAPVPGPIKKTISGTPIREGWLDIDAMKDAAKRLEGGHDFRNFCKIDPSKQISNHSRTVYHASIEEIDHRDSLVGYVGRPGLRMNDQDTVDLSGNHNTSCPKLYSFNVNGSAFLWHQVRCMIAVLFAVGQGYESPSVVSELLDVEKTPTKPKYEMASDAPLVLWQCIYPEKGDPDRKDALKWVYGGEHPKVGGGGKFARNGIMESLWTTWRQRKIDEILAGTLIDLVAVSGDSPDNSFPAERPNLAERIYEGGNEARPVGKYTPMMEKERLDHYEVLNARYRDRKSDRVFL